LALDCTKVESIELTRLMYMYSSLVGFCLYLFDRTDQMNYGYHYEYLNVLFND